MASRSATIEKQIKIAVEQQICKHGKVTDDGAPWRNWKIRIYGMDGYGADTKDEYDRDLRWVDHVDYNLHPSFKNPKRTQCKPPFTLTENGWGEFTIEIDFHFANNLSESQRISFELRFQQETYHTLYVLPFNSPTPALRSLLLNIAATSALSTPTKKRCNSTASKVPPLRDTKAIQTPPSTKKSKRSNPLDADPKKPVHNAGKMGVTTPDTEESDETRARRKESTRIKKKKEKELAVVPAITMSKEKLDRLKKRLELLEDDDVWEVRRMVLEAKTDGMMVVEDDEETELSMDLYTLGDGLLKKLDGFVKERSGKKRIDVNE